MPRGIDIRAQLRKICRAVFQQHQLVFIHQMHIARDHFQLRGKCRMIRQSLPVSTRMHVALQHFESAHIDTVQAQHRHPGRETARQMAAIHMENIVHLQFIGQRFA